MHTTLSGWEPAVIGRARQTAVATVSDCPLPSILWKITSDQRFPAIRIVVSPVS